MKKLTLITSFICLVSTSSCFAFEEFHEYMLNPKKRIQVILSKNEVNVIKTIKGSIVKNIIHSPKYHVKKKDRPEQGKWYLEMGDKNVTSFPMEIETSDVDEQYIEVLIRDVPGQIITLIPENTTRSDILRTKEDIKSSEVNSNHSQKLSSSSIDNFPVKETEIKKDLGKQPETSFVERLFSPREEQKKQVDQELSNLQSSRQLIEQFANYKIPSSFVSAPLKVNENLLHEYKFMGGTKWSNHDTEVEIIWLEGRGFIDKELFFGTCDYEIIPSKAKDIGYTKIILVRKVL